MALRNDEAVVLRLTEYSETSQVVTVLTRAGGQQRLIGKGLRRSTRKRISVGLDLLEHGELAYLPARGTADLGTLTEWVQRDAFAGLRAALAPLYSGLYFGELVTALTEPDDPHPELFEALLAALRTLSGAETAACGPIVVRFQLDLLSAIGLAPQFRMCVACQRPRVRGAPAWFSAAAGGLLCRECEAAHPFKRRLPPRLVDTRLEASPPRDWFEVFDEHLRHAAGRAFRLSEPLRQRAFPEPARQGL
jgi:DNA repair protein RecO (recombination protein O)